MTNAPRGTLASQLAPIAARLRQTQGLVRPISQVLLTCSSEAPEGIVRNVRNTLLRWVESKAGRKLPPSAWEGDAFELVDVGAQRAEAARLDDYWAARVDDADQGVARRSWVTEVALARNGHEILFGGRLYSVTRGEDAFATRSLPSFVRDIASIADFQIDGHPVCNVPWLVDSGEKVTSLVALLTDPSRRHPVCVFALPEGSSNPAETALSVDFVLRRTIGAAHIVILTGPASYVLTSLIGKEFSVFLRAVRTYRPGLDLDTSDPGEHPLALPRRIDAWSGGPNGFSGFLVEGILRSTVSSPDLETALPPYSRVKQAAQQQHRKARAEEGAPQRELLDLALEENAGLLQQIEVYNATSNGLLSIAEQERDEARGRLNEAESRIAALNARVDHLQSRLSQTAGPAPTEEIPEDFESLEEWGLRNLAGSVVLHNRALRAARKSPFENVSLAYAALLLLRDSYVPMRRGGRTDTRAAYETGLQKLHLEEAPCFAGAGARREGDAYFVEFRGRPRELDRHLKGRDSRDRRFGFRLYFFWDDESEQVVVGSLPNHLGTRIS